MKNLLTQMGLGKFLTGRKSTNKLQMLKDQELLLHHGLVSTAEVLDTTLFDEKVGNLLLVRFWLRLKKESGGYLYTHSHTLIDPNQLPHKGQILRIRYCPEDLSAFIIL